MSKTAGLIASVLVILLGTTVLAQAPGKPAERKATDKASPMLAQRITGKVTQVDQAGLTFTIAAKGKQKVFIVSNFRTLPRVGEMIDVEYTDPGTGGPLQATTVKSTKSNTSE